MHGLVVVAGEVAAAGALDLDHPGAEVGQLAGGERGRHRLLQCDDREAVQRQLRFPGHQGATELRLMSWRAMTLRWISLVPSPTIINGASLK